MNTPGELSLLRRLWPHIKPDAWAFGLSLALTPVVAAVSLAQPYLLKTAIDDYIVAGRAEGLAGIAGLFLGSVALAYVLEACYALSIAWGGLRTIRRLRQVLYRHVLSLSQSFFDRRPAGLLLTRLTSDIESLGESLSAGVVTILLDALMIVGTLAAMLWLNARLTLALLALAPLLLLAVEGMRRQMRRLFLEIRDALAALNSYLAERVDGVEVEQLYGHEAAAGRAFDVHNRRFRDASTLSNIYESAMFSVVDGFSSVCVAVMLWYGAGQVGALDAVGGASPITAGLMVAFLDYLDRLFRPIRDASNKITILQRAAAALVKIFDLLDEHDRIPEGEEPVGEVRGHLVLRDVRFRYRPDSEEVLRGVNLEVRPGEVVAIVGSTGSGKTTVTRLLDRTYSGYSGEILLDGRPLGALRLRELRARVAAVRQDIQLFSESVRFNVSLGNPEVTDADCESAATLVNADRCVRRVGWEHVLRDRGADVSSGEGQLLTFARTMAHDPDLIILDEATASVDSITEALIQDALSRIFSRKTVLVIAHRLSTIQSADRIAVMERGVVVESGSHGELLARGGRYADLVAAGHSALGG